MSAILSVVEPLTFLYGVFLVEVPLSDEFAVHVKVGRTESCGRLHQPEVPTNLGTFPKSTLTFRYVLL